MTESPNEEPQNDRGDIPGTEENPLESAIAFAGRNARTTGEESFEARQQAAIAQRNALVEWARSRGLILDPGGWEQRAIVGGAEHDIWEEAGEIWKVTRPDHFGWTVLPDDEGVPYGAYATPLDYLERWAAANRYLGDGVKLRGIAATERGVQVVVSQPFISGGHPAMSDIVRDLESRGFIRIEDLTLGAEPGSSFYHPGERIAIFDAAPDNFIVSRNVPVPVDVVVMKAGEALHAQLMAAGTTPPRRPRTPAA